jgi:formylglycine-generating enzyme required for sulfatase activity
LKSRVDDWRKHPDDDGTLMRGGPLRIAEDWLQRRGEELADDERGYIDCSLKHESLEREQKGRLLHRTAQMRALACVLLGAIVAGLAFAAWSNRDYVTLRAATLAELLFPKTLTPQAVRALKPQDRFRECASCPEMVVVPAGEFTMGSPATEVGRQDVEGPQHKVMFANAFAVSRFEITFDEWDACVTLGGCPFRPGDQGWGRGARPVININAEDVQLYVGWLRKRTGRPYRLLSEAEWEYAARAGSEKAYSWGGEIGVRNANCLGCGSQWDNDRSGPVGSFAANAFGLHDMHGNVFEWLEDCYHDSYAGAPADGVAMTSGDCRYRVFRGGSFNEEPKFLRSASRFYAAWDSRTALLGIRVARTLAP